MASSRKRLVIVGAGEFAEIAYEYFTHDSDYEVVAFAVEQQFLDREQLFELPIVAFESVEEQFPPAEHEMFVAITNIKLNRVRSRLARAAKEKGYALASYVSSHAFVWRNVAIGENTFIFENNVLQYHVKVGNNVVLWSGNHIGHRTVIGDNCFLTSHVVVSGYCTIGRNCFLGVNSCVADHLTIGDDCVLGMGAVLVRSADAGKVYLGSPAKPIEKTSFDTFGVGPDEVDS